MPIEVWCRSDRGLRRSSNQDSFLINKEAGLFVVADGMGGHSGGEVASSLAVSAAEQVVKNPPYPMSSRDLMSFAYLEAGRQIYKKAEKESPELSGMGTTMVVLMAKDNSMFIGNVGDSRVYLFARPNLWQITEDHSLVNEQLRAGILTEDQAKNFAAKNVITRSVGYEKDVNVDVLERPLRRGEMYLLCSDGLSGLVTDEKIEEILNKYEPQEAVEKCVDEALNNGGDDNVTVMLVAVT